MPIDLYQELLQFFDDDFCILLEAGASLEVFQHIGCVVSKEKNEYLFHSVLLGRRVISFFPQAWFDHALRKVFAANRPLGVSNFMPWTHVGIYFFKNLSEISIIVH
jgi:hypothetical protein